jgi:acyl-CoA reductase-like NAD-dependent aldehyde dehydrogenase
MVQNSVTTVLPFDTVDEVVARANAVRLAGGVWTRNLGKAHRLAAEIQAGTVWANTMNVKSVWINAGD